MNNIGKEGADVSDPLLQDDPVTFGFTAESSTATATTLLDGVDLGGIRVRAILAGISDLTGTGTSDLTGISDLTGTGTSTSSQLEG